MPESGVPTPQTFWSKSGGGFRGQRDTSTAARAAQVPRASGPHTCRMVEGLGTSPGGRRRRAREAGEGEALPAAGRDCAAAAWAAWFPLSKRKERKGKRSR